MSYRLSVGILAYNEAASIATTIDSIFAQSFFHDVPAEVSAVEVVCVPNGCTDDTAARARAAFDVALAGAPDGRVQCRVVELPRGGKTAAWNEFVHRISDPEADFLLLMDGDVRVGEPGRLPWLSQYSTLGIRPVLASSPPADFGPRADVYALPKPGRTAEEREEWAHVRKARAMGFVRTKEMAGIRAALYWTNAAPQAGRGGAGGDHESSAASSATRPERR